MHKALATAQQELAINGPLTAFMDIDSQGNHCGVGRRVAQPGDVQTPHLGPHAGKVQARVVPRHGVSDAAR